MKSSVRAAAFAAILFAAAIALARADDSYSVRGMDVYRIGTALPATHIVYSGNQHLSVVREDNESRFVAEATYTRSGESGKATVHARFVQVMNKDGSFDDRVDEDPDFLTILNQPFAVQLDARTMHDLEKLHGPVPFEATSPLGGARLKGTLRPAGTAVVRGKPATGIRFSAGGPMTGTLPQHDQDNLTGTIRMDGTAYYSHANAMLVALDATLTIEGKLSNESTAVPVKIVYHRTIRVNGDASWNEARR
ncbi:MAG TPA: hypothetical protein VFN49_13690 [Candidatus Aquilonibacter sp.]|nr:hypothetical protein [Candidatus Aquilonibacter sp.]